MKSVALAGVAFGLAMAPPVASCAAELFNQNLAAIPADGMKIDPHAKPSGIQPQTVAMDDAHHLGGDFNFEYSVHASISGSEISLVGLVASIKVHDFLSGLTATFDPSAPDNPGAPSGAPSDPQNSERIIFGVLEPIYNPNLDDTFSIVFTLTGLAGGPLTVDNMVVGSGAAEPTVWGPRILGLGFASAAPTSGTPAAA